MAHDAQTNAPLFWTAPLAFAFGLAAIVAAYTAHTLLAILLAVAASVISIVLRMADGSPHFTARLALGALSGLALIVGVAAWSESAEPLAYVALLVIIAVVLIENRWLPRPTPGY